MTTLKRFLLLPCAFALASAFSACIPESPDRVAVTTPTPNEEGKGGPYSGGPGSGPNPSNPNPDPKPNPDGGPGSGTGYKTCRNTVFVSISDDAASCYIPSGTEIRVADNVNYTNALARVTLDSALDACSFKNGLMFASHIKTSSSSCQ